jgi:glycosyltransferase involved in cell wall biosynthesis
VKILVLTNLYPPHHIGGYELICQTVVDQLRERGHTVPILASDHHVASAREQNDDPEVERLLRINGLYGQPWRGVRQLRPVERANNQILRQALDHHRPDLIYVWNMGGLSKSMLLTLQASGLPTVFYLSDHWIVRGLKSDVWLRWWNQTEGSLGPRLARACWNLTGARQRWQKLAPTNPLRHLRFERIYFCSRALRDLTAAAGYDVAHGAIIYCPIHPRFLKAKPKHPRKSTERLLYVGRLAEDKGVMTALRALALLRRKLSVQLSIYGHGEMDYVQRLEGFVREHELRVNFTSASLEQMPEIYRDHDLLLFTSEWAEPFALTPLEAMASSLPVVGTTTGGSAELFRNGENALTYAAGNPEELAARIWQLACDEHLRASCVQRAYDEARQRYAAPVIVDQIEAYLQESVRDWRPPGLPHYSA